MKLLILLLLSVQSLSFAQDTSDYNLETSSGQIDYLWSLYSADNLDPVQFHSLASIINSSDISRIDSLKFKQMKRSFLGNKSNPQTEINDLSSAEALFIASTSSQLNLINLKLNSESQAKVAKAFDELQKVKIAKMSNADIQDVLFNTPDLAYYRNGKYKDTLKLFMFCRENRNYPCRLVAKDIFGNFIRKGNGDIWSIPTLAKSARNIPFNKTNGETPTGVHTIDSVMPEANRPTAFGQFRRLILNWIPASTGERNMKHFLPKSQLGKSWWKRASIARDVGRLYLRIHGTGKLNSNPSSTWYPHMPTSGCISTREGRYPHATYRDQRVLLDKLMQASGFLPAYSNETNLTGVLWVMNIDSKRAPVSVKDLELLGL
jgi:hypothetical protein